MAEHRTPSVKILEEEKLETFKPTWLDESKESPSRQKKLVNPYGLSVLHRKSAPDQRRETQKKKFMS